jgi:dihydrofolate synthase/folylpolyglutamate synthase
MFESADEVFEYLGSFVNFEKKQKQSIRDYRLDRMEMLLGYFGNPHRSLRTIHIAGSKGKGSTGLYLARGLEALGEKTGLYSSPHVSTYRERITRGGEFFDDALFVSEGTRIIESLPEFTARNLKGGAEPSAFELLTLLAFLVFKAAGCTVAVIETGIGGRLDATNVVSPVITLITPIELEHTDILGDTIPLIAGEKAGIIKEGIPVFVAVQRHPEALEVIRMRAREKQAPLVYLPEVIEGLRITTDSSGTVLKFRWTPDFLETTTDNLSIPEKEGLSGPPRRLERPEKKELKLPVGVKTTLTMLGTVQGENAALALTVLRTLLRPDLPSDSKGRWTSCWDPTLWYQAVKKLSAAQLPARMEILGDHPPVVIDGAHTPASIRHVLETFARVYRAGGICIFGSVLGKNARGMAPLICQKFEDIIISTPGTFKPSKPEEVLSIFREYRPNTTFFPSPAEALIRAIEQSKGSRPILVTGSFYMASEIRKLLLPVMENEKQEAP